MMNETDFAEVLRSITLWGGRPTRKALAETGVDIEILEAVFEEWRRRRDYLRGYESLDQIVARHTFAAHSVPALERSGHKGKHRHALVLINGEIRQNMRWSGGSVSPGPYLTVPEEYRTDEERESSRDRRLGRFMILVTRDLDWFIYVNFPEYRLIHADGPRDTVQKALAALPAETWFAKAGFGIYPSLALEIADQLRISLKESVQSKEDDLKLEKPSLERITNLMETFEYGIRLS